MNWIKFIRRSQWHLFGQWKEVPVLEFMVTAVITSNNSKTGFGFVPRHYLLVNHKQRTPQLDFEKRVALAEKLLRINPQMVVKKMKANIKNSANKLYKIKSRAFTESGLDKYLSTAKNHGKFWYEIMVFESALEKLYSNSLPDNFLLSNQQYTSAKLLAEVALPKQVFPMIGERKNFLKIVGVYLKGKDVERMLLNHASKFGWMNSLCWWDEPFDVEYYRGKLEEFTKKDLLEEQNKFRQEKRSQYRHARRLLKELRHKYPLAWTLVDIIREMTDLKEENWDVISIVGTRLRPVLKKIAAKYYLSYLQFMALFPHEMQSLIKTNKLPMDINILNQRLDNLAILMYRGKYYVWQGKSVRKIANLFENKKVLQNKLSGSVIWQGIVSGKVRVIPSVDYVSKMKSGEILVCPMTDPDFLPAIHKAKAIITDQGGLLCHAAIVAREFQIPCIVGTQIATKVLKDGDLVEVDANKGVVRKLKK